MREGEFPHLTDEMITEDLDVLNSLRVDIEFAISKIKRLKPYNSGREKSIVITKLEEANHRVTECINLQKKL